MSKPTGRLAMAYSTIANMESKIAELVAASQASLELVSIVTAERDALVVKCVALENFCAEVANVFENMGDSSINSARLKRIDKEMNIDAKSILAAHDAEVAKKAVQAALRMYGNTDLSNKEIIALSENYAESLNK